MEATEMVMYSSRMVAKLLVAMASQLAMKTETIQAMYITELKASFEKEMDDIAQVANEEVSDGGTDENLSDKTNEQ